MSICGTAPFTKGAHLRFLPGRFPPGRATGNSPAFQRWVEAARAEPSNSHYGPDRDAGCGHPANKRAVLWGMLARCPHPAGVERAIQRITGKNAAPRVAVNYSESCGIDSAIATSPRSPSDGERNKPGPPWTPLPVIGGLSCGFISNNTEGRSEAEGESIRGGTASPTPESLPGIERGQSLVSDPFPGAPLDVLDLAPTILPRISSVRGLWTGAGRGRAAQHRLRRCLCPLLAPAARARLFQSKLEICGGSISAYHVVYELD